MSDQIADIVEILHLEPGEQKDEFIGKTLIPNPFNLVAGGQFLGQSLNAALQTLPNGYWAHSLHSYFMHKGDPTLPIKYVVVRIQDGKTFAKRRVRAYQKGRACFGMVASFTIDGSNGIDFQKYNPPECKRPEMLLNTQQLFERHLKNNEASSRGHDLKMNQLAKHLLKTPFASETKPIDQRPFWEAQMDDNGRYMAWMKVSKEIDSENSHVHACALAYMSDDSHHITTIKLPYIKASWDKNTTSSSLDHSLWIHRPFRADRWMLGVFESNISWGGRGTSKAEFFQDGNLVVSCVQEGLVKIPKRRNKDKTKQKSKM